MGKHSKPKSKHSNRKKILTTSAIAISLLTTQTAAYAAVDKPQTESVQSNIGQTETLQRVVEKSGIVETGKLNTSAIVAPVTASKDATVSFEKPVITATPNPERIAEEARIKAAEAAKVEAEKQAAIDAEAAKVAAEKQAVINAEAAKVAQTTKAQQATQYGYSQTAQSSGGTPANSGAGKDSSTPASGRQAAILAAARAQIGVNQDCTMLVTNSLKAVGINFHDWPAGYLKLGPVTNNPQPGDLIYYVNGGSGMAHIAVYAGNGKAIHGGFNGNSTVEFSANVGSGPVYISMA